MAANTVLRSNILDKHCVSLVAAEWWIAGRQRKGYLQFICLPLLLMTLLGAGRLRAVICLLISLFLLGERKEVQEEWVTAGRGVRDRESGSIRVSVCITINTAAVIVPIHCITHCEDHRSMHFPFSQIQTTFVAIKGRHSLQVSRAANELSGFTT